MCNLLIAQKDTPMGTWGIIRNHWFPYINASGHGLYRDMLSKGLMDHYHMNKVATGCIPPSKGILKNNQHLQ